MRLAPLAAAALGVVTLASACASDGPNGAAFCSKLAQQQALLANGVGTQAEIDAAVASYQALGKLAPLAVRDSWQRLTVLFEQAATINPVDPNGQARLRELAYESQSAADEVSDWARATCGIELRPATTVPPNPAAPTTSPPST
jgi:hypothetical protein